jgi:hypothetical protein
MQPLPFALGRFQGEANILDFRVGVANGALKITDPGLGALEIHLRNVAVGEKLLLHRKVMAGVAEVFVKTGAGALSGLDLDFDLADTVVDGALLGRPPLREIAAVQFKLVGAEFEFLEGLALLKLEIIDLALKRLLLRRRSRPDLLLDRRQRVAGRNDRVLPYLDILDQTAADRLDRHRLSLKRQRRHHDDVLRREEGIDQHREHGDEHQVHRPMQDEARRRIEQRRRRNRMPLLAGASGIDPDRLALPARRGRRLGSHHLAGHRDIRTAPLDLRMLPVEPAGSGGFQGLGDNFG